MTDTGAERQEAETKATHEQPPNEADAAAAGTEAPSRSSDKAGRERNSWNAVRGWLNRYMLLIVLVGLVLVFSTLAPDMFATFGNLRTILSSQSALIIVALGLTFPLAAGEFDLSFGMVLGFSSSLLAVLTANQGWPLPLAVTTVFATALVIGLINAFFAVRLNINSLIITIGTGTILTGLTLAVSGNQVIAGAPPALVAIATTRWLGIPIPVYIGLLLATLTWYIYEHTPLGRHIYFVGDGRKVARLAGLPVNAIRAGTLVAAAAFAAIAGMLLFGRLGSADPNIGTSFMLPGFATVFLGATSIKPGRFNAWGTVIAVYVLVVGITGLQLLGGAGWLEQVFNGAALVIAVTFASLARRSREE